MQRTALVTGASGQDGWYLIRRLADLGYQVHAQSRRPVDPRDAKAPPVRWHTGELTDQRFLEDLVGTLAPNEIYNLAAVSRPTDSWAIPDVTAEINALLPQRICELLLKTNRSCRFFQASSSDIFGESFTERQDERTHCVPTTPYGVAKLYAHRIIGAYRRQYGLFACSGILFNHESPLRPLHFVSQKIAYAAAAASLGIRNTTELDERGRPILAEGKLLLGDLSVRRDFGFAGDVVDAMHLILQHHTADDYVIGTGEVHSIQSFCEQAFAAVELDWTDFVSVDPKLIRKVDSRYTRADPTLLKTTVGWQPKLNFDQIVEMMVAAQVERLRGPG